MKSTHVALIVGLVWALAAVNYTVLEYVSTTAKVQAYQAQQVKFNNWVQQNVKGLDGRLKALEPKK